MTARRDARPKSGVGMARNVSRARKESTRESRQALYAEALEVMREECADELTLERVARRIATSPRQLQRAFDEAAAPPFQEVLIAVRLDRARELLRDTDLPIDRVAGRVGYQRPSSFAKAFRRAYGMSPSEFRAGDRPR
jgi:AraC family transcriptional regulator of adaptative response / methylphosphotriester-DNA alkyltransferase methyltransferase